MHLDFSVESDQYQKQAKVQAEAGAELIKMMVINENDSILDLGCGPGHLTYWFAHKTASLVVGVDPAEGMINSAIEKYQKNNLKFTQQSAEMLADDDRYNWVFCNSAWHWFVNPNLVIEAIYKGLKAKGQLAIQMPFSNMWCPLLNEIMQEVSQVEILSDSLSTFNSPWKFYNSKEEASQFFEINGFVINNIEVRTQQKKFTAREFIDFFNSAAAKAYFNQANYSKLIPQDYGLRVLTHLQQYLTEKYHSQSFLVDFRRLFLIAEKKVC